MRGDGTDDRCSGYRHLPAACAARSAVRIRRTGSGFDRLGRLLGHDASSIPVHVPAGAASAGLACGNGSGPHGVRRADSRIATPSFDVVSLEAASAAGLLKDLAVVTAVWPRGHSFTPRDQRITTRTSLLYAVIDPPVWQPASFGNLQEMLPRLCSDGFGQAIKSFRLPREQLAREFHFRLPVQRLVPAPDCRRPRYSADPAMYCESGRPSWPEECRLDGVRRARALSPQYGTSSVGRAVGPFPR